MRNIGDRISWSEKDGVTVFVITQQVEGWKVSLLATWILAFTFCLAYFSYTFFNTESSETQLGLFIFIMFMVAFLVRAVKAYLWRRFGKELLRVSEGELTMKRDIRSYGKARNYFIENVKDVKYLERSPFSMASFGSNAFWNVGGEVIEFTHLGRPVRFGCQLAENEARELVKVFKNHLTEQKKKASSVES